MTDVKWRYIVKCPYTERLDCPYGDGPTDCSGCDVYKGFQDRAEDKDKEGMKFDNDKLRWDLLPLEPIEELVKVITFGAKKYAPNNWRKVDNGVKRYYAACMRHIVAHMQGKLNDAESGISHLAHAICNLVFMYELQNGKDDSMLS
jgi:hypothetical protein